MKTHEPYTEKNSNFKTQLSKIKYLFIKEKPSCIKSILCQIK